MRNTLLVVSAATALMACLRAGRVANPAVNADDSGSFNGAKVEITADGGFRGERRHYVVQQDDRSFAMSARHLSDYNPKFVSRFNGGRIPPPLDTASGTLSAATADSLFRIVLGQRPFSLKDDYGKTPGRGDFFDYTLTVTAGGVVKTIRADDGTMPPQMRRIEQSVRETISPVRR
jgi:hypothetical protein